jgi:hypothetical protein
LVLVSDEWAYRGFQAIVLENHRLRATVLPGHGAKILELASKRSGRDLLYHHPRFDVRQPTFGANVDNWWTGGIDEVFPTVAASTVGAEELPYLGELWSLPWAYEIVDRSPARVAVRLSVGGVITPVRVERHLELRAGEPFLRATYQITNVGPDPVPYIWGLHPGVAVRPGMRIELPAGRATFMEGHPNVGVAAGTSFAWPLLPRPAGSRLDVSLTQSAEPPTWGLFRVDDLAAGWLAVMDPEARCGFGMTFDASVFQYPWLWLVYGGWRGIYTAATEVWTSDAAKLDEAITSGTARVLAPGETVTTEARYVVIDNIESVERIDRDGTVVEAPASDRPGAHGAGRTESLDPMGGRS